MKTAQIEIIALLSINFAKNNQNASKITFFSINIERFNFYLT